MLGPSPNIRKYLGQWQEKDEYLGRYVRMLDKEYDHVTAGFLVDQLPTHCAGDCWCAVQRGPVSEVAHIPRFPPCARDELRDAKTFCCMEIVHVSRRSKRRIRVGIEKRVLQILCSVSAWRDRGSRSPPQRARHVAFGCARCPGEDAPSPETHSAVVGRHQ
jgi:hypothetical protein